MPSRDRTMISRRSRPALAPVESLEQRTLLSISVQFDYTLDANGFFADPVRRLVLERAASDAVSLFGDRLEPIKSGNGNTWTAVIDNPATGNNRSINNLSIAADTILIYAGGREMSALGVGGPGGHSASGQSHWLERVSSRGQGETEGEDAVDFGPWGGSISFDTTPAGGWFFGNDIVNIPSGATDFYSVALHEVMHVLGFGTSSSWERFVDETSGTFSGPASVAEYDQGTLTVPLNPGEVVPGPAPDVPADLAHWKSGTEDGGEETAMDPELGSGIRKRLTALDFAGLDDIGWELPLRRNSTAPANVTTAGVPAVTFTVTYTHYTAIDTTTIGGGNVTVTGPNGVTLPATVAGIEGEGKSVKVTYSIAAPNGVAFGRDDSGTYTVSFNQHTVGDGLGNFAPAGEMASFEVDVDAPPTATLTSNDKPKAGEPTYAFTVAYEDVQGVDAGSIDVGDVTVVRVEDGLALAVSGATFTATASGGTAVYTVDAPGGSWDPDDNGTYEVRLVADQVRDAGNTPASATLLGTFEIAAGTLDFAAGRPATYTDADGGTVVVTMSGPGAGRLVFDDPAGTGTVDARRLVLSGTTGATSITLNANGAGTTLGDVTADGSLRAFTGKNVDLSGTMSIAGTLPKIQLRNAGGAIAMNAAGAPVTITLAAVRDLSITSASPIKSIKVSEWLDTDDIADLITTPALSTLTSSGTLQAHVEAGSVTKVTAGGALAGAEIRAAGSIGTVTAASATGSLVYAGVRADLADLPGSLTDFINPAASIKSFTLRGRSASFSDTRIAAPFVAKAALGTSSNVAPSGNVYGLAADRITTVTGSTSQGTFKLTKRNEPGTGTSVLDFAVVVL